MVRLQKVGVMNTTEAKRFFENNQELQQAVFDMIAAQAAAKVVRKKVDNVYKSLLEDNEIYEADHPWCTGKRIMDNKHLYLASDEDFKRIYAMANRVLVQIGIKPPDMDYDYCPALVAENYAITLENAVIDMSGAPFEIDRYKLVSMGDRQEWLDLVCKIVLSL